ncbi:hypothetical protein [Romboutsia hominis]|nr:hypothetical protein [Romboutsia hominis]
MIKLFSRDIKKSLYLKKTSKLKLIIIEDIKANLDLKVPLYLSIIRACT